MNQNDTVKIVTDLTNTNMERMHALGELNRHAWERMTARQMDLMGFFMAQTVRGLKLASEYRSFADLAEAQIEMAKAMGERMMEESKTSLQVASEVRNEYRDWYKHGLTEVVERMRVPAAA